MNKFKLNALAAITATFGLIGYANGSATNQQVLTNSVP